MRIRSLVCLAILISTFLLSSSTFAANDINDVGVLRAARSAQLNDPYRPLWHFTSPEWICDPFDPNGAVCKDGIYHLWYLYQKPDASFNCWAHVSSKDLLHWRWHSFAFEADETTPEKGINSGSAFVAEDGTVGICYQGVGASPDGKAGNCIAYSVDPNLDVWTRAAKNPTAFDCSDVFMHCENGKYYLISGWRPMKLFVGDSYLEPMTYVGDFMSRDMPDVDPDEDLSCPDFFKLGDKYVLIGISHQKGTRYYVGTWDGKQFTPEAHWRMNWPGGNCSAPKSLVDASGRRIMWAWLRAYDSSRSNGVLSMPRVLTLAEDGKSLNFAPAKELENLRFRPKKVEKTRIEAGQTLKLDEIKGKSLELDVLIDPQGAKRFGVKVFRSQDGREETPIIVDLEKQTAAIKLDKTSLDPFQYWTYNLYREPNPPVSEQVAPISIPEGEKVRLRIFLDQSILEVFIGECQCVSQLVRPTLPDAESVEIFADDAPILLESLDAWEMFPTNQW